MKILKLTIFLASLFVPAYAQVPLPGGGGGGGGGGGAGAVTGSAAVGVVASSAQCSTAAGVIGDATNTGCPAAQIYATGLIGRYQMSDASGTTLPDISGAGNNGTLVGSPTVGTLGISFNGSSQSVTLPAGIASYKTVQIFLDTGFGNLTGFYGVAVGSTTSGKTELLLDADSGGQHFSPSAFNGGFTTTASAFATNPGLITLVTDPTTDTIYVNGTASPFYTNRGGTQSTIAGTIQLADGAGGGFYKGQIYYVLFYNTELTSAQVAQNYQAISAILTKRGVLPQSQTNTSISSNLIYDGDSITAGQGVTTPYPGTITTTYPYTNVFNLGVSGYKVQASLYQDQYFGTILNTYSGRNVAVVFLGTNDMCAGSTTPAQTLGFLAAHMQRLQQQGWYTAVVTMLSRTSCDTQHDTYNALIRTNWPTFANAIYDVAANPLLGADGAFANATYFQGDGVHPTQTGQNLIGAIVQTGLNSIGIGVTPNLQSFQSVVAASTSGTATFSQPLQGASYKKVVIFLSAALGTATYTFPTAFVNTPSCIASAGVACSIATSISGTAVTITGATSTGFLYLEGY